MWKQIRDCWDDYGFLLWIVLYYALLVCSVNAAIKSMPEHFTVTITRR